RDGIKVGEVAASQADKSMLMSMMVGREIDAMFPQRRGILGDVVLRVCELQPPELSAPVSFEVREGEIFGIAGLVGSGRSELLRAIFGATRPRRGWVEVGGTRFVPSSPGHSMKLGLAMVPEDRKLQGLIMTMSVCDNVVLNVIARLAVWILRRRPRERRLALELIERVGVRAASIDEELMYLSGGNQQKALLAKWLACEPRVLLLDEPTRGIDVGAKHDIYQLICDLAERGLAVVMVSSEMEELIGLCDRVLVMNSGRPAGILEKGQLSERSIMELAAA
ncbi:MAG: sugar ABC transporter ATP-binding protein, partial [Armatimonadetes bacterium]|nr:sugar ABC transporter ATP-binding protein [Armatimonadota bacterium]